ncbi:hypothetical protein AB0L00_29875 [Actinoallomurus sp. NPDC052308]|uniref:hypothetical protein n=1 Tax=Actinoallomurus sp. NPDC052308 TaxID=3155530 RepID=UPI0034384419
MSKKSGGFVHGSVVPSDKAKIDSTPHTPGSGRSGGNSEANAVLNAGMANVRKDIGKAADIIRHG